MQEKRSAINLEEFYKKAKGQPCNELNRSATQLRSSGTANKNQREQRFLPELLQEF